MVKGWLRDRVADIACLSGRTDSGLSLHLQQAHVEFEQAAIH